MNLSRTDMARGAKRLGIVANLNIIVANRQGRSKIAIHNCSGGVEPPKAPARIDCRNDEF
jgi:hypothetical protein